MNPQPQAEMIAHYRRQASQEFRWVSLETRLADEPIVCKSQQLNQLALKDRANGLVPSVGWFANDLFGRWIVTK